MVGNSVLSPLKNGNSSSTVYSNTLLVNWFCTDSEGTYWITKTCMFFRGLQYKHGWGPAQFILGMILRGDVHHHITRKTMEVKGAPHLTRLGSLCILMRTQPKILQHKSQYKYTHMHTYWLKLFFHMAFALYFMTL